MALLAIIERPIRIASHIVSSRPKGCPILHTDLRSPMQAAASAPAHRFCRNARNTRSTRARESILLHRSKRPRTRARRINLAASPQHPQHPRPPMQVAASAASRPNQTPAHPRPLRTEAGRCSLMRAATRQGTVRLRFYLIEGVGTLVQCAGAMIHYIFEVAKFCTDKGFCE